jgi:SAM-dependent methyltransferase
MLAHVTPELERMEADAGMDSRDKALAALRSRLGLDDFGEFLISLPHPDYPRLSALLPSMASEEIQRRWTGNSGLDLLRQSCNFVRSVAYNHVRHTGRLLDGARILDFGCGYGRIARLMYYFTGEAELFGVDPWDRSIALCRDHGLGETFMQSDDLPRSLPTDDRKFDLIYAFSVFTHLSMRTAKLCMATLRDRLRDDGLLVVTIRPMEYWHADPRTRQDGSLEEKLATHRREGFVFRPEPGRAPVEGEVTFGDTSMSLDWLAANFPGVRIVGVDRCIEDGLQIYVFLKKA